MLSIHSHINICVGAAISKRNVIDLVVKNSSGYAEGDWYSLAKGEKDLVFIATRVKISLGYTILSKMFFL